VDGSASRSGHAVVPGTDPARGKSGLSTAGRERPGPAGDPSDLLRRLVCFIASALDVRFAIVAGLSAPRAGEPKGSVAVWLARDYGLRFAFGRTERPEDLRAESRPYEEVLRRLWPAEPDLVALMEVCGPALPVQDSQGRLLGHLAVLDPGPAHRLSETDRLNSLVRLAATELERWAAQD
jgi:hypothetical protein